MKSTYKFRCKTCGGNLVKAGKTPQGKQRYKCSKCNTRNIVNNPNKQKQNQLKMFVKWLICSTKKSDKIVISQSTFYRKTSWCWSILPKIKSDENSSDFVLIDATYLTRNLCLLIVRNEKYVLNFRWSESENFYDYYELLKPLKEPGFVICDGHSAIIKAAKKLWKNAGIQRCLVHISRDAQRKLGKRSPCIINQIFRNHINKLPNINSIKKSKNWLKEFDVLYETHKDFIEEKTLRIDELTGEVIRFDRTHKNLFSATRSIQLARDKNTLFGYLESRIPNNSNRLEGGINSPLKNLMRSHRGISQEHQKRLFEWYLLSRSETSINDFIFTLDFNNL